jgi:hypothetical protein
MPLPERRPLTLASVDRLSRGEFAAAVGGLFKHSDLPLQRDPGAARPRRALWHGHISPAGKESLSALEERCANNRFLHGISASGTRMRRRGFGLARPDIPCIESSALPCLRLATRFRASKAPDFRAGVV